MTGHLGLGVETMASDLDFLLFLNVYDAAFSPQVLLINSNSPCLLCTTSFNLASCSLVKISLICGPG